MHPIKQVYEIEKARQELNKIFEDLNMKELSDKWRKLAESFVHSIKESENQNHGEYIK